jgi:hypothetical protein
MDFWNSLIVLPMDEPTSGKRLGPKNSKASIARGIRYSGRKPIVVAPFLVARRRTHPVCPVLYLTLSHKAIRRAARGDAVRLISSAQPKTWARFCSLDGATTKAGNSSGVAKVARANYYYGNAWESPVQICCGLITESYGHICKETDLSMPRVL